SFWLRHYREGLRVHVARRSGLCGQGGADFRLGEGRDRISGDARYAVWQRGSAADRCLSFGLLAPAWAKRDKGAKRTAFKLRLPGERCAGRPSVLRLGRDL